MSTRFGSSMKSWMSFPMYCRTIFLVFAYIRYPFGVARLISGEPLQVKTFLNTRAPDSYGRPVPCREPSAAPEQRGGIRQPCNVPREVQENPRKTRQTPKASGKTCLPEA